MSKARSRRDLNLRRQIAYIAARMMAEDGIADYATAKQKAARQAGLGDANLLPDNQEIEEALREYQGLYQKDEQPARRNESSASIIAASPSSHPRSPAPLSIAYSPLTW